MNIRCRSCGAETPDYARYCIKCGAEVDDLTKPRDTMTYIGDDGEESPVYTNFPGAIRLFFKNYVNFSGRSTRSEYWYAFLFTILVSTVIGLIGSATGSVEPGKVWFPSLLWSLVIFIPLTSAGFRRLHDIGRSGTIYIVGYVVTLIWALVARALLSAVLEGMNPGGLALLLLLLSAAVIIIGIYLIVLLTKPSLINNNPYGRDPY